MSYKIFEGNHRTLIRILALIRSQRDKKFPVINMEIILISTFYNEI